MATSIESNQVRPRNLPNRQSAIVNRQSSPVSRALGKDVPSSLSRGRCRDYPRCSFPLRFASVIGLIALAGCRTGGGVYPSRELKLVVQAAPGGISDTVSRVMASLVEKRLGVPLVCENKPGAAGALAFSYVTRRPPDGYTLGHAPVEIAMVRTLGYADIGPEKMDLVCLVSKTQPVLAVLSAAAWKSFEEFLSAARASPGRWILGNSGTGSIWHFNGLLMEETCKIRVTHVPFNGSSAAITALLGGHIDAVVAGAGEVISNVNAGQLRVLAVMDTDRSPLYPGIPTSGETGHPFGASAWSGFYTSRGVSESILDRLEAAFREAFDSADFQKLCVDRGMQPLFLGRRKFRQFAEEQAQFFSREIPKLLRLVR